ncbi:hypothetical protein [Tunicatimonas pelagia]|uniref:hypothetical protein n=1 Tax=Tunicatimonas pelagia TaxID=931531 RepID=UPI00266577E7|nr:hypothetical protein [Tunicatimonas pelagia]WKN43888.1 hypothetical protein P0M28_02745 [Tunicatimonas pelagia]
MKESEEFNDETLSAMMKAGARTLPNQHFENQVMHMVQAEIAYKKTVKDQLKISLKLFLGALLTAVFSALFILVGQELGVYTKIISSLLLFIILLIGIVNIGNYRRLIGNYAR